MVDYKPILSFLLILFVFGGFLSALVSSTGISVNQDNEVMSQLQSLLFPITSRASIEEKEFSLYVENDSDTSRTYGYITPEAKDLNVFQSTINGGIIGLSYIPNYIMLPFVVIYIVSLSLTITMYIRELIGFT